MKTTINFTFANLAVLCCISVLSSCTVIGFGVGSMVDHSHKIHKKISTQQLNKLDLEQIIIICTYDSSQIKGTYQGLSDLPFDEYKENYTKFKSKYPNDSIIPDIGDTLMVFNRYNKSKIYGKLIAFETNSIRLVKINNKKPLIVEMDNNVVFYNKKNWFDVAKYKNLPRITILQMEDSDEKVRNFDLNDIAYILPEYRKNIKLKGAITGLVIDTIIVAIVAASFSIDGVF